MGQHHHRWFPPVETADEYGIVAIGGDLTPGRLLAAYREGIFPWPAFGDGYPIPWCSPDPRAVIELDGLHVARRLARKVRQQRWKLTCDRDFAAVIRGCAAAPRSESGTWITGEMIVAYLRLHRLGFAHSVEVWEEGAGEAAELVGGLYGVALGGMFAAESMFHRRTDASKVALVHLVHHLRARRFRLLDVQQWTPHTGRMGAIEIPRREFLRRLREAVTLPVTFGTELTPLG